MSPLAKTYLNIQRIDQSVLQWATTLRRPGIDFWMRGFTRAGDWQTWSMVALLAVAIGDPFRSLALKILPKLIATFLVCLFIKSLSKRPRPSAAIQDFRTLLKNPDPYSFPSSHSACAWTVAVSLGLTLGWGWPFWIGYASAISISRIHVGAHYPLDVLMGTIIGTSLATLF